MLDEVDMPEESLSVLQKILNIAIFIGIIIVIALLARAPGKEAYYTENSSQELQITDDILALFPEANQLKNRDTTQVEVYDQDTLLLGYLLYTSPYADQVYGFAGATPLLIGLNGEQKIVGVVLLENNETGSYNRRIIRAGFMDSWNGSSVEEALQKEVDAISGATLSTEAIKESLRIRLAIYEDRILAPRKKIVSIIQNILALCVVLWALFAYFNPKKGKNMRIVLLGISIIVLGLWQGKFISLANLHAWLSYGITSFTQWVLILIVLLSFLLPLIFGKSFYCTWLCPFGAAQELVGKITKKKVKLPAQIYDLRRYYLLVIVFLLISGIVTDLAPFEPFSAFNLKSSSAASLILAGIFTLLSVFINKPWCRFCCPTGQLLDFFRSSSIKNIKKHEK